MGFGSCENLESFNYSNFNDNICYVTALGRNPSTGVISMYRVPMVAPEAGTFPLGQMFSGDREKQDGYNTFGKINSSSQGNEIASEQTTSISLRADTVYNAMHPEVLPPSVNRNTIMAMLEGSGIDDNGVYVEIIGTSGNRLICPTVVTDAKYLFYKDGYFVIDGRKKDSTTGKPSFRSNPYIDKYNKTNICSTMEIAIGATADDADNVVYRFPFVSSSNVQFAEGNEANNYTADAMFLSDRLHASQLLYDGFSANEVDSLSTSATDSVYKVNADYILVDAGTTTGDLPTVTGVAGEIAIVIPTLTGTSVSISGSTVTGIGTSFDTEIASGDSINVNNVAYTVSGSPSATSLTIVETATVSSTTNFGKGVRIFKYDSSWINAPITNTLGKGFVAWTSEYHTALDGTGGTSGEVNFMAVKTAGVSGFAVAGEFGTGNYVISARSAIVNTIDRTAFFQAYTV